MIQKIDLSSWKKQSEIIFELHSDWGITITPREWIIAVERHNKRFINGEETYFITHSNRFGYKATNEYKEAKIGINDYLKRAFNMIKKARDYNKAFNVIKNYQIDFETGEIK